MRIEPSFSHKLVLVAGVVLVLLLAWELADVLLLIFSAVLGAILFRSLADLIARPTKLSPGLSLMLAVVLIVLFLTVTMALFGTAIAQNVDTLLQQLPSAWAVVRERISGVGWLSDAIDRSTSALLSGSTVSRIGGALGTAVGVVTNMVLVLFGALYIAAQPGLYRNGVLRLVPPAGRARGDETLQRCGKALQAWLVGQVIAMALVGAVTMAGLAVLGVPSAIALGLFAGIAEFVPILGPIASAVPALIIAFSKDTTLALYVLGLFVVIQQIEGNVIQPIIQKRMVSIPPAVLLFAVIVFAILFGPMGVLFAAPLTVVAFVAVNELYVRTIEEDGEEDGEPAGAPPTQPAKTPAGEDAPA
ncbi:hypothetical protein A33M_2733 [Rhodovulum sp. PH10]|uniref:AI-2E family transporter n=1 Tax=Rhodovulum sp. PH10 TaxID=1187851 RepID=UPI00027C265C|nr:AI-2E family transporter [Rhodovulum sp. PH10]EJW11828.1 hypothetical protein A33M_2733 [Rhodovulum sp. PH10]